MAEKNPVNLNGEIGLTLSGGGYRAAAFHLGVIDYLQHLRMLDQVKMLSTVSGGTFTGAKLALAQAEKQDYSEFFDDYYQFLANTDLLALGLDQLGGRNNQAPSGRQDMIVSMAQVYADTFLKDKSGEPYRFDTILNAEMNLREISFNATEFRHALAFRFQRSENRKAYIGNYRVNISREDAEKVRVADIVAASSCFPGGFEPFAFPYDFIWPDKEVPTSLQEQFADNPLPLMDGGIYDNQGLQSLLLADERNANDLDLFIISDVDQKSNNLYPYPKTNSTQSSVSLNTLAKLSFAFLALMLLTFVLLLHRVITEESTLFDSFFFGLIPLVLVFATGFSLYWIRKTFTQILDHIPFVGRAAWRQIKHLTIADVIDLTTVRISSLFALAGTIFMKRIRSLVYGLIYGDFRKPVDDAINEMYAGKRISNLIYHLKSGEPFDENLIKVGVTETSEGLTKIATRAADMPTTLWFENEQQLQDLLISGRATLCYNLMKYLLRNYGLQIDEFPEPARRLWDKLLIDWKTFNTL